MPPGVLDDSTVLDTEPVVLGSYDAEPMGGVGLGRLWDTHPKVAFVLHLLVTVYLGALAVWLLVTGATGGGVVLTIGFAVMAGSLFLFIWLAAQSNWQSVNTSYDGRGASSASCGSSGLRPASTTTTWGTNIWTGPPKP